MKSIKVKTPAKINLTLQILGKREDGYHNIQSIMQALSLYDYITIQIEDNSDNGIAVSGNNPLIPYDKTNLAYVSAEKFLNQTCITGKKINIFIEKNIPVAAGLAGGSSDAAGVIWGLNYLFGNPLDNSKIEDLTSQIGADVNFCFFGGTQITTSKGEILEKISTPDLNIAIVKPQNLFISAREAYEKYSKLEIKPQYQPIEQMLEAIDNNDTVRIASLINNGLEASILPDYPEIQYIKEELKNKGCLNSLMSGSGPSVFGIFDHNIDLSDFTKKSESYNVFSVKTIPDGVSLAQD